MGPHCIIPRRSRFILPGTDTTYNAHRSHAVCSNLDTRYKAVVRSMNTWWTKSVPDLWTMTNFCSNLFWDALWVSWRDITWNQKAGFRFQLRMRSSSIHRFERKIYWSGRLISVMIAQATFMKLERLWSVGTFHLQQNKTACVPNPVLSEWFHLQQDEQKIRI